ncbi:MAG TPA: spermidine synthase, partial [Elusimicrobiota bacterium]|nr:spermidine synthase [Elusimicrobiota bacterium]
MPSLIMLLSGAAALAYEVVWMRMLGRAFGVTVYAAAAVVAVYMAGLALGAAAAAKPRPAHRALAPGLRVYAALETALALAALAGTAWLARLPALLSARGYDAPLALGWRVLLSLPALLPATFLMGTTLPVLVRRL